MQERQAVSMVLQPFLKALHYLHTQGIVHRCASASPCFRFDSIRFSKSLNLHHFSNVPLSDASCSKREAHKFHRLGDGRKAVGQGPKRSGSGQTTFWDERFKQSFVRPKRSEINEQTNKHWCACLLPVACLCAYAVCMVHNFLQTSVLCSHKTCTDDGVL